MMLSLITTQFIAFGFSGNLLINLSTDVTSGYVVLWFILSVLFIAIYLITKS